MDSDQLDIIARIAAVGPIFYGQAYTWIKQNDSLILVIILAGSLWSVLDAFINSPRPMFDIAKNLLFVFLVTVTFYKPVIFQSMSEYAPVSAATEKKLKEKAAVNGNVVMAMPYPTYWAEKALRWIVGVGEAMVRSNNRFIISEPSNTAQNMATEAAFNDAQLNGSTGAWNKVMGPALLERYPALKAKLNADKPPLMYRFLNPTSPVGDTPPAIEARKVLKYMDDAGIDFAAVAGTNIGMTNAYTSPAINWTYEDGKITAPLLQPNTRAATVAAAPPSNSSEPAKAAFAKGYAVLSQAGDISQKPVGEEFTNMNKLYESLGNARDIATATYLGSNPEKVVVFGATCQTREKVCIEKLAGARDNASVEIRESSFSNNLKSTLAGGLAALSAPGSAISNGLLKQMLPQMIGLTKGLIFLAMPIFLLMGMWSGRSQLAIVITLQLFVFVAIWNLFYVFYVGWGSSLFFDSMSESSRGLGGIGIWANFALETVILGGMGVISWSLVFSDFSKGFQAARGGATAGQQGGQKLVGSAANAAGKGAGGLAKAGGKAALAGAVKKGLPGAAALSRGFAGVGSKGSAPPPGAGGGLGGSSTVSP